MKRLTIERLLAACVATVFSCSAAFATEVALTGDAHVSSARSSTNFGTLANLYVGNGNTALLQFDLSTLPSPLSAGQISHATLTVFVNRVNTGGVVSLSPITSTWSESGVSGVTYATIPSIGPAITSFTATAASAGQYVTFDVSSQVQSWIASGNNYGFALTSLAANILLDSKENDETGHAAKLDITITSTGATGSQGIQGATGLTGPTGATGATGAQGPQGPQGPAGTNGTNGTNGSNGATGATGTIGTVANWSSATAYTTGQVVFCAACSTNGSSYIAVATNTNIDPPTNSAVWHLIAQAGSTGAAGSTGPQGPTGPQGLTGTTGATGATGSTGATGATGTIGTVANWSSATAYTTGQVVFCAACSSNGSSYIAISTNTNVDPPTNSSIWHLIAQAGSTGATGPQGPAGTNGTNGTNGLTGSTGPQGATGPAGPFVGGTYSASVDYPAGSVVVNSAITYVALQANGPSTSVITPGSNVAYWLPTTGSGGASVSTPNYIYLQNNSLAYTAGSPLVFPSIASHFGLTYNTSTGIVTIPSAGTYVFDFYVANGEDFAIYVNGVVASKDFDYNQEVKGHGVLVLNAGDLVSIASPDYNGTASAPNSSIGVTFSLVEITGVQGATGATGATGAAGTNGTNGAPGVNGTNGAAGVVQAIAIGTVTTSGSTGSASIGGTSANPTINLTFPTGGGIYGDGSDGTTSNVCTISSSYSWVTNPPTTGIQCTNFVVNSGVTLTVPSGTLIHATGTVTITGNIVVAAGAAQGLYALSPADLAGQAAPTTGGVALSTFTIRKTLNPGPYGGGNGNFANSSGGQGGGSIIILASGAITIGGSGSITADGVTGVLDTSDSFASGGGGGGWIILASKTSVTNGGTLTANGGQGGAGNSGALIGNGGGGGGGVIHLLAPSGQITIGTESVAGGTAGANANLNFYGDGGGASGGNGGHASGASQAGGAGGAGLTLTTTVADPSTLFTP